MINYLSFCERELDVIMIGDERQIQATKTKGEKSHELEDPMSHQLLFSEFQGECFFDAVAVT